MVSSELSFWFVEVGSRMWDVRWGNRGTMKEEERLHDMGNGNHEAFPKRADGNTLHRKRRSASTSTMSSATSMFLFEHIG